MMYRVEFQIAYGGRYFSESFEDYRDAENFRADIAADKGPIRFLGVEASEDGELWYPLPVMGVKA